MLSMEVHHITDRLVRAYRNTYDSERTAGIAWYYRAQDIVAELSARYGQSTDVVAGVIAALSPLQRWSTNVKMAEVMLQAFVSGEPMPRVGLGANCRKAWAIMESGELSALSGPKVTAFAENLRGNLQYVTVDSWALRAVGAPDNASKKIKDAVRRAYARAANRCGVTPAEFQAVIWVQVRGRGD